jgi:uncharacterized protein
MALLEEPSMRMFGLALVVSASIASAAAVAQQPPLPTIELVAGVHRIEAEVADSFSTRMQGLMHRTAMAPNRGMVFLFEENRVHCMWMKNTLLPLSVAFIDERGEIINIEDMQPQSEQSHCSKRGARYALEMNRGWFASRNIKAGFKLRGLDRLSPPPATK